MDYDSQQAITRWHTAWPQAEFDTTNKRHASDDHHSQLTELCHEAAADTTTGIFFSECSTMHLADWVMIADYHRQMEHATRYVTAVQQCCSS